MTEKGRTSAAYPGGRAAREAGARRKRYCRRCKSRVSRSAGKCGYCGHRLLDLTGPALVALTAAVLLLLLSRFL